MKLPVEKPKPDIDHFVKVIKGDVVPARPPFAELLIDREVIRRIGEGFLSMEWTEPGADRESRKKYWDFVVRVHFALGYDYLWVWGMLNFPKKVRVGRDASTDSGEREWAETSVGAIRSWDDFEAYPWPVFDDECLWDYEYVSSVLPEGMGIFASGGDGFLEVASHILFGYEGMCYLLYDDPALVDAALEQVGDITIAAHKKMLEVPKVAGVFMGDDMGYIGGTLFAPGFLEEKILPWHQKLAEMAHEKGLLYMLHSCGDLGSIMDTLINKVKIDAKHSFEDKYNPVGAFKEKYGDRVAVLGGVDLDVLCRAEEGKLRQYIRNMLDACMENGRYAFGSGNSIANYVPIENYLIMLDEGWKYSG